MKNILDRFIGFFQKNPKKTIIFIICGVLFLGYGAKDLQLKNNYRMFFSPDNPDLVAYDEFQGMFSKTDNILYVIKPKEGGVFNKDVAATIELLTNKAWNIPYSTRVDSISNFQHSYAQGNDLTVENLYTNANQMSQTDLDKKKIIALNEPLLLNWLISPDAKTTGINVTLNFPGDSVTELPKALEVARGIREEILSNNPNLTIAITGIAALNDAFSASGKADAMSLMPIMFLLVFIGVFIALRDIWSSVGTFLVVILSTISALGVAGHLGIALDPISITAVIVILTLSVADSVHFLMTTKKNMLTGMIKSHAIKDSFKTNFLPITITSITTVIGYLMLNFSDSPPFWYLGNITSIGIISAWIISLTFLPSFISIAPLKIANLKTKPRYEALPSQLSEFIKYNTKKVLIFSILISLAFILYIPKLQLDDQWIEYFDESIPFRPDAEFAMEHLTGLYTIEYALKSKGKQGVSDPEYLHNLEKFSNWLKSQEEIVHVYSYSDIIKRLNKNMNSNLESSYVIPSSRELAAQYLLLYELSLPYGLDLNSRINIDKSSTRISATGRNLSTAQIREFTSKADKWMEENLPSYMWTRPTGPSVMFSYISQRNIENMISGNIIGVITISIILIFVFRSLFLGFISIVSNFLPIAVAFGIWTLLVGKVGMAAATVSATSLGIIVDNSVHFISKYNFSKRHHSSSPVSAIKYAYSTVGKAIFSNSIILFIGFSVLATSTFKINNEMGLLTAIVILIALIIVFFTLPALLILFDKYQNKK